jgi:hypothetical protein
MSIFTKKPNQELIAANGNQIVPEYRPITTALRWLSLAVGIPMLSIIILHQSLVVLNYSALWAINNVTAPAISMTLSLVEDATNVHLVTQAQAAPRPTAQQLSQAYDIEDQLAAAVLQDMSDNQPRKVRK